MMRGLEHFSYTERLRSLGLFTWRREGSGETLLQPSSQGPTGKQKRDFLQGV